MSAQGAVTDSIRDGVRMGAGVLQAVADSRLVGDIGSRLSSRCSCDIPPPCWMPKALGEVKSFICAGGTAVLRLRITNCGAGNESFKVEVADDPKKGVTIAPATLSVGPMERGVVTLTLPSSTDASKGEEHELLVWVRGCHDHYARWTVTVGRGSDSCHELDVDDCPDYLHHWYDHFYCPRPCPSRG
jgi:hypothetical protein